MSLRRIVEYEGGIEYEVALGHLLNDEQSKEELPDEDEDVVHQQAQRYYRKNIALCSYAQSCERVERVKSDLSFAGMGQNERHNAVRSILYVLSSPKDVTNNALKYFTVRESKRLKLNTENASTLYAILGALVCQQAFCAIVHMSRQIINKISASLEEEKTFNYKPSMLDISKLRLQSEQTIVGSQFLTVFM